MGFFRRKPKKSKGASEPLRPGVMYFVNGENVVFDMNGMDYTFEGFYLSLGDSLRIVVNEEAPMNLINLSNVVEEDVEVNRSVVLEADTVNLVLELRGKLYDSLKDDIMEAESPERVFDVGRDGKAPLLSLSNYLLVEWGSTASQ